LRQNNLVLNSTEKVNPRKKDNEKCFAAELNILNVFKSFLKKEKRDTAVATRQKYFPRVTTERAYTKTTYT